MSTSKYETPTTDLNPNLALGFEIYFKKPYLECGVLKQCSDMNMFLEGGAKAVEKGAY